MRHFVCYALFLATFISPARSQPTPADATEARREVVEIRHAADKLIATGNPDDAAKAAALLEKASEIEQVQSNAQRMSIESQKLQQDLSQSGRTSWKDLVASLVPLLSTFVLAGTLIFQIAQSRKAEREKRAENAAKAKAEEQKRFMDTLKDIQISEKISIAAALINTFQHGPFKTEIRDMAVTLLLNRETFDDFQALFMAVMNPLTYDQLPHMRRVCMSVDASYYLLSTPIWDDTINDNNLAKLSPADRKSFDLYNQEQVFLSKKLSELLHTPPPANVDVDLSQLVLRDFDLSGVDLGTANIAATNWSYVNVDDCDMGRITQFGNSTFRTTVWWHAARISPPLLDYLQQHYPYSPQMDYMAKRPLTHEDYDACLAKLKAGGSKTGGSRGWGGAIPATQT